MSDPGNNNKSILQRITARIFKRTSTSENSTKILSNENSVLKRINKQLLENQERLLEELRDKKTRSKSASKDDPTTRILQKNFVLKSKIKNVSSLNHKQIHVNRAAEHFGVPWKILFYRHENHYAVILNCAKSVESSGNWFLRLEHKLTILGKDNKIKEIVTEEPVELGNMSTPKTFSTCGSSLLLSWEELKKDFLIDDSLTVEIHVRIIEMFRIYKENLRFFDEEDCSNMVLIVKNQRFHVAKFYLAAQSTYFKAMFLGRFGESNKSEIELTGIDADDFQNYLEVLYGESAIDECTVEGILQVADMYDTQMVIRKCEEFLLKESKKKLTDALRIAVQYRLEKLKKKCASAIESTRIFTMFCRSWSIFK